MSTWASVRRVLFVIALFALPANTLLADSIASRIQRETIAGIDVYRIAAGAKDVVILRGSLPAGDVFNPPDNPMIAGLVAGMLDKGTTRQDKFTLARRLESLGATIEFSGGSHEIGFSAKCLKEDLGIVVALLAEQLRMPAFAAEEFEKFKQQRIGQIQRSLEDPSSRASEAFSRAAFPEHHPNRNFTADEQLAGIKAASAESLRAFHAAIYGPAHMRLVVAGDVDARELRQALEKSFAGWRGGRALPAASASTRASSLGAGETSRDQTVFVPGKTSVNVVWGQATGLRFRDSDALALRAATAVLGSGFTGRLMDNVRGKEGLTYGIGAHMGGDAYVDGDWRLGATFAPALLDRGIAASRAQLLQWYEKGVTREELAARKTNLIGSFQVGLATTDGVTRALLAALQRGYGPSFLDEYPKTIEALTLEQVNGAIRRYLNPDTMILVKAGTITSTPAEK